MPLSVTIASPRTVSIAERQRDALERLARRNVLGMTRPARRGSRYWPAGAARRRRPRWPEYRPSAVRAETRPARAAERQHGRVGLDRDRARRRLERERAFHPSRSSDGGMRSARRPHRAAAATRATAARPSWLRGNTRPLDRRRSADRAPRTRRARRRAETPRWRRERRGRRAIARKNGSSGSLCVRLSPPRPAIRNLRPADGMRS